jgi:hypothetical protein
MSPETIQVEPIILFVLSLVKWVWGAGARQVWCFGFEVTAFLFFAILGIFTVNVIHEIKTALGINVLTV